MGTDEQTHLSVFINKSILFEDGSYSEFLEGRQSENAKLRYEKIQETLKAGFLDHMIEQLACSGFSREIPAADRMLLDRMAEGITSNYGRSLVAVAVMQLAIKVICPEQCIRLHKGSNQANSFSWVEGISMRNIDKTHITPFLRRYGLLRLNADGAMMTRGLAENYPYSDVYKAQLRGPRKTWLELVSRLESRNTDPRVALEYVLSVLQNKSDEFKNSCEIAMGALGAAKGVTLPKVVRAVKVFLSNTTFPARAFEIALHSFMQALFDLEYADGYLEPLSQMRSANKKHGNVGDIELKDGCEIRESWDAKYQKFYLGDELNELGDKLETASRVAIAGFVTDEQPDIRNDIVNRIKEIEDEFDTEIKILSLHEWVEYQVSVNHVSNRDILASAWLTALVESLCQRRGERAPIDEPCDTWVDSITTTMRRSFK